MSAEFTRQCLVERYSVDPGKIDVIYTGVGPEFSLIDDVESLLAFKIKNGLDKPFIFYPAASWPHKNHRRLLAALKLMIDQYGFDGSLVLTGIAFQSHSDILENISELGLDAYVKVLG